MVCRQRFRISNVQIGSGNPARSQLFQKRILVHRRTATNVVDDCATLQSTESGRIEKVLLLLIRGQDIYYVVGQGQQFVDASDLFHSNWFVTADVTPHRNQVQVQRLQKLYQPARNRSEAEQQNGLSIEELRLRPQ